MKKAILIVLFLGIFQCQFEEGKISLIVDVPEGVTNVEKYGQRLCELIAERQGR